MTKQKIKELEQELNQKVTYDSEYDEFKTEGGKVYKVYTEEEAEKSVKEEIEQSLWAFTPEFIFNHMINRDEITHKDSVIKAIETMQQHLCESANPIVKALIEDIDAFVDDATEWDGRGHFLSHYDGIEIETENFYAYRID